MKKKEFVIIICFIVALLVTGVFFPTKNAFQSLFIKIAFLGAVPMLFNKIFLKRELRDIGLQLGNWKQGLIWSGISVCILGVMFFVAFYFFDFLTHYPVLKSLTTDYRAFVFYELTTVLFAVVIFEFFFRGFVMLTLESKMHYWAIAAQALIFLILVLATGDQKWMLAPYVMVAPLAGLIVYKSRSIFYSSLMQWLVIIMLDAGKIYLIRHGS